MIKKRQSFIHFSVPVIMLFLLGCDWEETQIRTAPVLKVGSFEVTYESFTKMLDKVSGDNQSRDEACQTLFDNYISTGILTEMARKKGYQSTIAQALYRHKLQLYRKYKMLKRCESVKIPENIRGRYFDFYCDSIQIDYVWIPLHQKELAEQLYERMKSGAGVENLLSNSRIDEWNKSGLRFYSKISPEICLPTEKVWDKIRQMKEKEICLLSTNSGLHIIKLMERRAIPPSPARSSNLMFIIKTAYALEKGDTLLSLYALKNKIKLNTELLSALDFSVDPIESGASLDQSALATVKGRMITEPQLKKEINRLPPNIQAFFKNSTTREKAVATLLLCRFAGFCHPLNKETNAESYSFWTSPEALGDLAELKFNFTALQAMEIPELKDHDDNRVIASSGKWVLTMKEFREVIHKLSPESKIELFKENAASRAIAYLAKEKGKVADPQKIEVKNLLLSDLDILENAMDSLNISTEENARLGTLLNNDITAGELRKIVASLPENEKSKFKNEQTRENAFKELLVQKFWNGLYTPQVIEKNRDFKEELKEYENWLLAQSLYETEILTLPTESPNETSNVAFRMAAADLSRERLYAFCQKHSKELDIKANEKVLRHLGIPVSSSLYKKAIHLY